MNLSSSSGRGARQSSTTISPPRSPPSSTPSSHPHRRTSSRSRSRSPSPSSSSSSSSFASSSSSSSSSSASDSSDDSDSSSSDDESSYGDLDAYEPPSPPALPPPFPHHLHLATPYASSSSPSKVQRKADSAKRKHRTSLALSDWQRYGYAHTFPQLRQQMYDDMPREVVGRVEGEVRFPFQDSYAPPIVQEAKAERTPSPSPTPSSSFSSLSLTSPHTSTSPTLRPLTPYLSSSFPVSAPIDLVHCRQLSVSRFISAYEQPYIPCMIDGLTAHWPARHYSFASLAASPLRHCAFKCGEDDAGYSIKMKLKHFLHYATTQHDDSPLYIFCCAFDEHPVSRAILGDFTPPPYFTEDLFHLVGEAKRPPYRWIAIGPERSGSSLHIDPLATSAWNTLLLGVKRWVLFPPSAPKALVKGDALRQRGEDNEAVTYFLRILPRIKEEERRRVREGGQLLGMREMLQYPGQTIFVPGGWWHAVLNLEDTVAVTQNYVSTVNFPAVWRRARGGRRKMAQVWLRRLWASGKWAHLATMGVLLNEEDGWEGGGREGGKARKGEKKRKEGGSMMCGGEGGGGDGGAGKGVEAECEVSAKRKKQSHDADVSTSPAI